MIKRAIALTGAASLAALAFSAAPASADVDGIQSPGPITGSIQEKVSVKDAGGVQYDISILWRNRYKDAAGTMRVSVSDLAVHRSDKQVVAAGEPEDAGLDAHYDSINPSGAIISHRVFDDLYMDAGADNIVKFNPRNPKTGVDAAKVRIKVGTDGDGLGSSRWVVFYQPPGLPIKAT
jgi:hypothetical protein